MEKAHPSSNLILWVRKLEAPGISSSPHLPFTCSASDLQHLTAACPWASTSSFHSKVLQPITLPASCGHAPPLLPPCILPCRQPMGARSLHLGISSSRGLGFQQLGLGGGAAWCPWPTLGRPAWLQPVTAWLRGAQGMEHAMAGLLHSCQISVRNPLALVPWGHRAAGKSRMCDLG